MFSIVISHMTYMWYGECVLEELLQHQTPAAEITSSRGGGNSV
jgi:hypothetical protein